MNRTPLERAIDEQREHLFLATAIIDTVTEALRTRFGDWPANVPEYPRALTHARQLIDDAAANMEVMVLESRAEAIEREARNVEVSHAD